MLNKSLLIILILFTSAKVFSQAKVRKLPTSINHPAINVSTPYVCFDGDALFFLSDNAEDYKMTPFFSYRESNGDWKEPRVIPANVIYNKLCYVGGFTLGPEGKTLYYSSLKGPGVGGFDLWVTERSGLSFKAPRNLGAPLNSNANEASATFTPDGKTVYFMRCDKMDQQSASGCKIFQATKKTNGQWNEPIELPSIINTGNSQTPRILADSETLIFSSDKFSDNKGGMDLYISKWKNGNWTTPKALDFVNTEGDDQYISVSGLGRYLLRDSPGARKSELVEYLIPEEFRPKGLMRVDGKVNVPPGVASYISVIDLTSHKQIFSAQPGADGTFTLFLLEGSAYQMSIDPGKANYTYYSETLDLTGKDIPQFVKVNATISPVVKGSEIELSQVQFKPYSSSLTASSGEELKRIARIIKSQPDFKYEIQVMLQGYQEDSVKTNPDLTQMIIDSVTVIKDDIDSLGNLVRRDSIYTRVTYHNDRTNQQAESILSFLEQEGVNRSLLNYFVNARQEPMVEKRKVLVKLKVK